MGPLLQDKLIACQGNYQLSPDISTRLASLGINKNNAIDWHFSFFGKKPLLNTQTPLAYTNFGNISSLSCGLVNCCSAVKHCHEIRDLITFHNFDLLFLTETWLTAALTSVTHDLVPEGFVLVHVDRTKTRGGAVIFRDCLRIVTQETSQDITDCDLLLLNVKINPKFTLKILLVYHPPGINGSFNNALGDLIALDLASGNAQLLLGDLNRWFKRKR